MNINHPRKVLDQQIPHYGLRKLKSGVTSVLLSTAVYAGISQVTAMASTTGPETNVSQEQTQVVSQKVTNDVVKLSQTNSSANQSTVPVATSNVNSILTNQNISNVQVNKITGQPDTSGVPTAGSTHLSFDFSLSADQVQKLKAGDYVDIQMGLPYTVTATGQTERLSYGRIVNQSTPVEVWSQQGHLIGYIVPVNADNAYAGSQDNAGEQSGLPEWTAVQKKNVDAVKQLGATNGYYRLIFVSDINKYGAVSTKINALNWYNAFENEDGNKAPTNAPSFTLYSSDASINSYTPQNDIKIGNAIATSGLTIRVVHNDQAAVLNTDDEFGANTSTRTAAHWWYQRGTKGSDGQWVLGYNSLNDPVQSEGVSLTHQVGNEFDLVVTKPTDTDNVTYYFADDDQVKKDLDRTIVGSSHTYSADQLNNDRNISISRETVITKPKVAVTSTQNGNIKTYHVKIDGEYLGFRHDTNGSHSYPSTITLLSWQPKNPLDLLPPADSGITDYQSDDPNGITKKYPHLQHVSGVLVDSGLIHDLEDHPWKLQIAGHNGQTIHLKNVGSDGQAGYFFMKNPQLIFNAPVNYGIAVGSRPTFQKGVTKQIIHYWYDHVGGHKAAPDTVREVLFNSSDNGKTWYNGTSPEEQHFEEGQFYNVDVPSINGYLAYAEHGEKLITQAGYQSYYTYGHPELNNDYTRQPNYDAKSNALVVNVIYRAQEQHLLYQVVLENTQGQIVRTVVPAQRLATGKSGGQIGESTSQQWSGLLKQYHSYTDLKTHQSYQLVSADNHSRALHKTDRLPNRFDSDTNVDQLVTIYLAPETVPVTPVAPQTSAVTIHYQDVDAELKKNPAQTTFEPNDGVQVHQGPIIKGSVDDAYTVKTPWDFGAHHYELASPMDPRAKGGRFTKKHQDIYVYLKHQTTPVKDAKKVTETIHYVYANGPYIGKSASDDYKQYVEFQRTGVQDRVTGGILWNGWLPSHSTMMAVPSPKINGYHADQLTIPEQMVNHDSNDIEATVYYSIGSQNHQQTPASHDAKPEDHEHVNQQTGVRPNGNQIQMLNHSNLSAPKLHVTVGNKPHRQIKLPQTGQSGAGLISLGLLAMASSFGLLISPKKK
ncbi:mucin-binding protein [uncultured Limosilactobacillus sp.]|uniref:mucin-binding protein n=1 Tax=uncultured Limosilactobacillus sp. TaxID=2837629 RepID=UPI0025E43E8C|nr:LPXTG cell wall anchor domain-containing protein [uncultured Limosilactobacillus sp.]